MEEEKEEAMDEEFEDDMVEEEMDEEDIEEYPEEEEDTEESTTTTFTGYGKRPESKIVPTPRSKFLVVICKKCKHQQTVFSKSSTVVHCEECNEEIVIPTGGEAIINARVVRVLG
jgi:small subunit ribosomal protein S27e